MFFLSLGKIVILVGLSYLWIFLGFWHNSRYAFLLSITMIECSILLPDRLGPLYSDVNFINIMNITWEFTL